MICELRGDQAKIMESPETDLKISRGKIVTVKGKTRDRADGTRTSERGAASGGGP